MEKGKKGHKIILTERYGMEEISEMRGEGRRGKGNTSGEVFEDGGEVNRRARSDSIYFEGSDTLCAHSMQPREREEDIREKRDTREGERERWMRRRRKKMRRRRDLPTGKTTPARLLLAVALTGCCAGALYSSSPSPPSTTFPINP